MQVKVKKKQPNSKMCLVCGLKNDFGLYTSFYELENGELMAVFRPREEHQSYPGRLHGGIVSTILDETIGRAIMVEYDHEFWGVTIEITIRFKKPVPLGEELRVVGRITRDTKRIFEGTGEILLADGTVAAEGWGKYMKLPLEKIAEFDADQSSPSEVDPRGQAFSKIDVEDAYDYHDRRETQSNVLKLHKGEVGLLEYLHLICSHLICSIFLFFSASSKRCQKSAAKRISP